MCGACGSPIAIRSATTNSRRANGQPVGGGVRLPRAEARPARGRAGAPPCAPGRRRRRPVWSTIRDALESAELADEIQRRIVNGRVFGSGGGRPIGSQLSTGGTAGTAVRSGRSPRSEPAAKSDRGYPALLDRQFDAIEVHRVMGAGGQSDRVTHHSPAARPLARLARFAGGGLRYVSPSIFWRGWLQESPRAHPERPGGCVPRGGLRRRRRPTDGRDGGRGHGQA